MISSRATYSMVNRLRSNRTYSRSDSPVEPRPRLRRRKPKKSVSPCTMLLDVTAICYGRRADLQCCRYGRGSRQTQPTTSQGHETAQRRLSKASHSHGHPLDHRACIPAPSRNAQPRLNFAIYRLPPRLKHSAPSSVEVDWCTLPDRRIWTPSPSTRRLYFDI